MSDDKQVVIEKIRKLLALSKSDNEHEAALAAERAHALLSKYNLQMEEVIDKGDSQGMDIKVHKNPNFTRNQPWYIRLAGAVAKLNYCTYYYQTMPYLKPGTKTVRRVQYHFFVGEEHNAVVAQMMFDYLHATVSREARRGSRTVPKHEKSPYIVSFRNTCVDRLRQRIMEMIKAAKEGQTKDPETGDNLPVLADLYQRTEVALDQYVKENLNLRSRSIQCNVKHAKGMVDGDAAGQRINITRQVSGAGSRKQIK